MIESTQGLENLKALLYLDLNSNQIKEIKGFEFLEELQEVDLNFNQISSIKGFEVFFGRRVHFFGNPIPQDQLEQIKEKINSEIW
ncbi:MAG: leucine-rich repeat domain-containing protein [Candidatus Thorarchaeota archaeon]